MYSAIIRFTLDMLDSEPQDAKHNKKSCYEIGDRINQLVRVMFAQLSDGGVKLDSGMVGRVRKLRE